MSDYEPNYTDLRMLDDGTRFRVQNGNWIGSIFSKDGQKYMHIDETGVDKLLTGNEQLIVSVLPKKKVSEREALANLKYSIEHLPFTMFDHKEVFDRQEVLKLVNECYESVGKLPKRQKEQRTDESVVNPVNDSKDIMGPDLD